MHLKFFLILVFKSHMSKMKLIFGEIRGIHLMKVVSYLKSKKQVLVLYCKFSNDVKGIGNDCLKKLKKLLNYYGIRFFFILLTVKFITTVIGYHQKHRVSLELY